MMSIWVFGYGSLLWNPGFHPVEQELGFVEGYARSFCMRSIHHRGSEESPGLVLALDKAQGTRCNGLALRVNPSEEEAVLSMLRERELISSAYFEVTLPVVLSDGRRIEAVCYVIDPDHVQYCHLPLEEQANIIATATGGRGHNAEYLFNTAAKLGQLGIEDAELDWLTARVAALQQTTIRP